ncbi:MAG: ATP-binding protein [Verrucomicrobiota bacterium]|jgi:signal transduction histidine kinase/CheY-like chemotaxis protein
MKPEVVFGLESAAWPALLASAAGLVLRANPAAASQFGAPLAGEAPQLSAIWSPDNSGTPADFLARWEQSPTPLTQLKFRLANGATTSFSVAVCLFHRDAAKWFVLQLLPAAYAAPAGTPDVAGAVLKQKLDCALQLARTVSLDFNNALTSILGHTSLLLGKAEDGHPWRHSLMEVEKSAARAAEIANELQTFSRQEKESHHSPPGNLNLVASRCVDFFRNAHGAKVTWRLQLEKGLFAARFDEAKIQQAITKIIENAIEAAGLEGRGQLAVQTRNVELTEPTQDCNVRLAAGAYVCVEITDNGPGIEPDILPRVFEPFFTTKRGNHRGLGLALVYGIVTNHGGGVAISSQTGRGVSARLYLPAEKHLIREDAAMAGDLRGTETILVVDDEALVLNMAETILTDFGYKVLTASGAQKALAILSRDDTPVDLLFTDLVMPGMGGRELIERARQLVPGLPILCASGYVMPADKQMDTAYLQKPFTAASLLAKVKQTIAHKQLLTKT